MEWNLSETLALAAEKCAYCEGLGIKPGENAKQPCRCVLRAVFRACYRRFRDCAASVAEHSRAYEENAVTRDLPGTWSRKNEEYLADFLLIAQRTLTAEEHKIFRMRYLLGADWRLCGRKLGMDKGLFHHACYRIEQKLGRVFREVEPYALFPLQDYFSSGMRSRPQGEIVAIRPKRATRTTGEFPIQRAA